MKAHFLSRSRWQRSIALCFLLLSLFSCRNTSDQPVSEVELSTRFAGPENLGRLESRIIDEASGLTASRSNEAYLWTHNDSGGEPDVYLLDKTGQSIGTYTLESTQNVDWEDIAMGPGPEEGINYLFVGDIGDNEAVRESRTIYRVPEPDLNASVLPASSMLTGVEEIRYQYPDGARDCETLMIDPLTRDIILVSKREDNGRVYRLPFPQSTSETLTAEFLTQMPYKNTVGGDISSTGGEILIKTYDHVFYWPRSASETVAEALKKEPEILNYQPEPQGEAIAWAADGKTYFTLSEEAKGVKPVLYGYRRN